MTLILSWYTPQELGKRQLSRKALRAGAEESGMAIYTSATLLGGVFSGALQAALYTNLCAETPLNPTTS